MITTPDPPHAFPYLALGDSYTIGERVPAAERWSAHLATLLREQKIDVGDPDIIAQTGWTTDELQAAIKQSGNTKTYGLVTLLIGVNNQYRGQPLEKYRTELQELLNISVGFAGGTCGRVFVLSIPDWGVTPYAPEANRVQIAEEIDAFNRIAHEECAKQAITFIDITPLSRTAANDPSFIADDKLHFSGKMYRQWAEKALSVIGPALSPRFH